MKTPCLLILAALTAAESNQPAGGPPTAGGCFFEGRHRVELSPTPLAATDGLSSVIGRAAASAPGPAVVPAARTSRMTLENLRNDAGA